MTSVCRTCLMPASNIKSVFSTVIIIGQEIALSDMLMECSSVTIINGDGLPTNLCLKCAEDLQKSFQFKRMCEESDLNLRQSAVNGQSLESHCNLKNVEAQFSDDTDDENIQNEWSDTKSGEEFSTDNLQMAMTRNLTEQENERKKKSYNCQECNEECLGLAAYWKHIKDHGKQLKCDFCEKEFKTINSLKQHKNLNHTERNSKRNKNKTRITKKRNLPRTCDICNKTFRFHSNLERHKLIHTGEKPYLCNVCGKGFGQMSYLKIHSFIHTGEKPYKCQMCDKSFAAPGTLMTHVRIHTGERPHVCKICGKDFPQSGYLSAHIRTHTGEKPIECQVCHRRFNQSGRLVIHMRIHSGEKPYSCKECGRCFAVRGTLKKHIRTHTGERPYVCSVCGQAFAQSGTLATHMKVHKPKQ